MPLAFDDEQKNSIQFDDEIKSSSPSKDPWYQRVANFEKSVGNAIQPYTAGVSSYFNSPAYKNSPQGFVNDIGQIPGKIGSFMGEQVAEQLGQKGVNPIASAGLGLATTMLPDIAMGASMPDINMASLGEDTAQTLGAKSLGFTKRFLNTEPKLIAAKQTAQDMLDQGVITSFASPTKMAERASEVANESGARIGNFLEKTVGQEKTILPQQAVAEMESLRPYSPDGKLLKGGVYDKINSKVDQAIKTIEAHGDNPISFKEANDLKGTLQGEANWASNKEATILDRIIAGKYRNFLDQHIESYAKGIGEGPEFDAFLKDKQLYQSALRAEDPLYNRISSELGNRGISLTDFILAAPELAAGNYGRALALLGGKKLMQQYGAQIGATSLNALPEAVYLSPAIKGTSLGLMQSRNDLNGMQGIIGLIKNQLNNKGGLIEPGNIRNLYDRKILNNPDGTYSTTSSTSFNEDGKEVLIPTVIDGKRLTLREAIDHYHQTGEHLGKFSSPEAADIYANKLHEEQAARISRIK